MLTAYEVITFFQENEGMDTVLDILSPSEEELFDGLAYLIEENHEKLSRYIEETYMNLYLNRDY